MLPREFFELGVELMARGGPANTRTGISRLYYAVHLEALRLARSQGFDPGGVADDHGAIVRHFVRRSGFSWLRPLDSLRKARNHADYHVEHEAPECEYCKAAILEAGLDFLPETLTLLQSSAESLFTRLENTRPR